MLAFFAIRDRTYVILRFIQFSAQTIKTELVVFEGFHAVISYRLARYVFGI